MQLLSRNIGATELGLKYWDEFARYFNDEDWVGVQPSFVGGEFSTNAAEHSSPEPLSFVDFSIDEIYEFHIEHIRRPDNSNGIRPFTYFTFLVIDSECVNSSPKECIICCDAPDYNEIKIILKKLRVTLPEAATILEPLEQLTMTPSEAINPDGDALCSIPPFTQIQDPDRPRDVFICATPSQARSFKEQAIAIVEQREERLKADPDDRIVTDDERYAVIYRVPWKDAEWITYYYQKQEELARTEKRTMTHSCESKGYDNEDDREAKSEHESHEV